MTSRYTANPNCGDCGKKKGPKQVNSLRCYSCQRTANRKAKETKHATHIKATYGITPEAYKALFSHQNGACAICQRATGHTRRLAVDHNHGCSEGHPKNVGCPECVRGLLCGTCNTFIGRMHDDPEAGDRMAAYLRNPPFQQLRKSFGEAT